MFIAEMCQCLAYIPQYTALRNYVINPLKGRGINLLHFAIQV